MDRNFISAIFKTAGVRALSAPLRAADRRWRLWAVAVYLSVSTFITLVPGVCQAEGELLAPTVFSFGHGDVKLLQFDAGPISVKCSRPDLCDARLVGSAEKLTKMGILLTALAPGEADLTIATATELQFYRLKISPGASDEIPNEVKATEIRLQAGDRQVCALEPGFVSTFCTRPEICETAILGKSDTKRGVMFSGERPTGLNNVAHVTVATPNLVQLYTVHLSPR